MHRCGPWSCRPEVSEALALVSPPISTRHSRRAHEPTGKPTEWQPIARDSGHSALRNATIRSDIWRRDERRRGRPAFVPFFRPLAGGALRCCRLWCSLTHPQVRCRTRGRRPSRRRRSVRRGSPDGRSRSGAWPARGSSGRRARRRRIRSRHSERANGWWSRRRPP